MPTDYRTLITVPFADESIWSLTVNEYGLWLQGGKRLAATGLTQTRMQNPDPTDEFNPLNEWFVEDEITVAFIPKDKITNFVVRDTGTKGAGHAKKEIEIHVEGIGFPLAKSTLDFCVDQITATLGIDPAVLD